MQNNTQSSIAYKKEGVITGEICSLNPTPITKNGKGCRFLLKAKDFKKNSEGKWDVSEIVYELTLWNEELIGLVADSTGNIADVKVRITSREYNGKYYVDLTAVSLEILQQDRPTKEYTRQPVAKQEELVADDDLPF